MKKIIVAILVLGVSQQKNYSQSIKPGDRFPDYIVRNIVNAPVQQLDINKFNGKYLILNFWGTWCAPCIPEMETLKTLQKEFAAKVQVLAIANDDRERVKKYLAKRPASVWIASDTSFYLYKQLGFAAVGQSAVLDKDHRVIAVVRTDSINRQWMQRLVRGEKIRSNADIMEEYTGKEKEDWFGIDSIQGSAVSLRSYLPGTAPMGQIFKEGPFANRRISFLNITPLVMYKEAFLVNDYVIEGVEEKMVSGFSDREQKFCFDILVPPGKEDSLRVIMQRQLNLLLPVKARVEKRKLPVYLLKIKTGEQPNLTVSLSGKSSSSFSGKGFTGTAIPVSEYASYLSNELGKTVLDETGLTGKYDMETVNETRSWPSIKAGMDKLGLSLEKAEREIDVIIFFK